MQPKAEEKKPAAKPSDKRHKPSSGSRPSGERSQDKSPRQKQSKTKDQPRQKSSARQQPREKQKDNIQNKPQNEQRGSAQDKPQNEQRSSNQRRGRRGGRGRGPGNRQKQAAPQDNRQQEAAALETHQTPSPVPRDKPASAPVEQTAKKPQEKKPSTEGEFRAKRTISSGSLRSDLPRLDGSKKPDAGDSEPAAKSAPAMPEAKSPAGKPAAETSAASSQPAEKPVAVQERAAKKTDVEPAEHGPTRVSAETAQPETRKTPDDKPAGKPPESSDIQGKAAPASKPNGPVIEAEPTKVITEVKKSALLPVAGVVKPADNKPATDTSEKQAETKTEAKPKVARKKTTRKKTSKKTTRKKAAAKVIPEEAAAKKMSDDATAGTQPAAATPEPAARVVSEAGSPGNKEQPGNS